MSAIATVGRHQRVWVPTSRRPHPHLLESGLARSPSLTHHPWCQRQCPSLRWIRVNAKSFDGRTPLHWATDNPRVITLLTDRGANIDTKEDLGMTPLHYAVAGAGNTKAISLLLDRGADIDAKDGEGLTCLHWVVRRDILSTGFGYDGPGVASLLLDRGADINARMSTGVTPCQVAVNADAKGLLVSREVNQLVCGRQ